jgi:hypothetical protein
MRATRESSRRNDEQGNERRSPSKQELGIQPTSTAAATILPPHLRTGDKISYYANNDFESVFIEEFLSHEKACKETIAKADIMNFTNLPGSTVHSHAEKHLIQQASKKSSSPKGCTFSSSHDHERLRLNELRKSNSTLKERAIHSIHRGQLENCTGAPAHETQGHEGGYAGITTQRILQTSDERNVRGHSFAISM